MDASSSRGSLTFESQKSLLEGDYSAKQLSLISKTAFRR